jgi:hypothetical protein
MLSVKGQFKDGVARPAEPLEGRDGQPVIITFLEEEPASPPSVEGNSAWDSLTRLVEDSAIETGLTDLAHQHDHYLYGKPKSE